MAYTLCCPKCAYPKTDLCASKYGGRPGMRERVCPRCGVFFVTREIVDHVTRNHDAPVPEAVTADELGIRERALAIGVRLYGED